MTDIASLGVKVESNLKTLNKDMEKTISLSEKVTDATKKMESQMAGVSSTTKNVINEEAKRQKSVDNLIKSLTLQEIRLKEGKIGLDNYKASILGATDAEKKQIAALNTSIKSMQDANTAAKNHDSVLGSLIARLSALGAAYFGVQAIKNFASSLIDTAKIMDSYKYSLLAVSENSTQAAETYEYLRKEADRLGLSLTTQEKAFTGFAAAAKQSGLRVEETRSIYTGLMEAMTAIHRSPEEASQALKAFQDMLSKGTIQAEELKKQLGNALPGAMAYMSDATGKSTAELMKMMEQGILPAKEGVMILSDYLSNKFQVAAENASNSVQSSINKMENAWFFLKKAIVDAMGDNTTGIIKDATATIKKFTDQLQSEEGKQAIKDLADKIKDATTGALALVSALAEILKYAGLKSVSGTFIDGLKQSEQGYLDVQSFVNAGFMDRQKMLEESQKKQSDHTKEVIRNLSKEENQWNSLFVETIKTTGGIEKGIKRVSDAQIEANKKAFAEKGASEGQAEAIQKIIDKIERKSVVAGMSSEQGLIAQLKEAGASKEVIAAQQKIIDGIEAKDKAYKDSIKGQKEVESEEKKRVKFIEDYIAKLEQKADTYKKGQEYTADYILGLKDATDAQKQRAKVAGAFIDAAKRQDAAEKKNKKNLEDYAALMKKVMPEFERDELSRQQSLELTATIFKDKLTPAMMGTAAALHLFDEQSEAIKNINEYFDTKEIDDFTKKTDELKDKLKFKGTSFGNEIADGINNAVISMQKFNDQLDKQKVIQKDIDKLEKEIKSTNDLDLKAKKQKEMDDMTQEGIKGQLSAYRQLFGTTSQLFKENSKERKALHNLEMAFAMAEIAMNLQKTISAAYTAIMTQGTGDPYSAFGRIAAMTALAGGIVAAAGGSLSGGSGSAPSVSASSTQGTGTVMGNPSEKSQSAKNALEFMKDIEAKQYNELRDINKGVVDLNNNITNLVTNIVRTGVGTGNVGVKTGTTTSSFSNDLNSAATSALIGVLQGGSMFIYNSAIQGMQEAIKKTNGLAAAILPSLGFDTKLFGGLSDWLTGQIGNVMGSLFGGSKKTSILAQGLEVSTAKIGDLLEGAALDIQKFADIKIKKSGGLFGSDKTYLKTITESLTPDEESIKIMFTNVFKNVGETMVAISKELNLGDDKLKEIYSYTFDIGKIDLKGMDTEQINEAISSVINTASDQAVTALFGELIGKYVQVGEALFETAIRVVSERAVVLDILEMTGQGFKDSDIPAYSLEITQSLIGVAGGIKELQDASATYYDKFFSDEEKQIRLQDQLSEIMASMGQSMPSTREGLRKIVESLDLTTEAGQRGYVTLLGLSESFDSVFSKIEADNEKKLELELQIMNLTGKGAEALAIQRQKEIESLSEANKPLQQRIYDLQDESAALEAAKKEADERTAALKIEADAIKAINEKKFDLEIQILKLTGKESEALILQRQKEIDSLDEINKPLQERIYALTDEAKAIEKINTINAQRKTLEIELLNATGKTAEATAMSRQIELASMDESLRSLKLQIWAANDLAAANELVIKAEEERIQSLKDAAEIAKQIAQEQLDSAKTMLQNAVSARIEFLTDLEDKAKENLQVVKDLLQRSFEYEKNKIISDHELLIKGLTSRLDEAKLAASDLEGVFSSLSSARKNMFVSGSETEQYKSIQAQLFSALGLAQGGNLSGAKALSENISGISGGSPIMFSTEEEYKRDFFKTYRALSELEGLTGTQLTEQQQIVKKLETQIEIADVNNKLTLESLQDQYDAVLGVDKSVISFADAVLRYQKAQYEANGANALLKEQTEILTNQMNTLLGINQGIISVNEAIEKLVFAQAAVAASEVPAFANGGYHSGGPMLVGERGIEVINAPPAMVTSNNDLKSIISNEEVVAELKAMRTELARANFELVKNSGESKKTLREWQEIGILTRTA